jgi:carboxypeptidase family protein/TonB-dependent receptor-like protein
MHSLQPVTGPKSVSRYCRAIFTLVAGVALLCAPSRGFAMQAAADETSIVTAIVTDSAGKGLSGVEVSVVGTDLRQMTDETGQVYISGVPARKITLHMRHVGYKEADIDLFLTPGVRTNTTLVLHRAADVTTLPKVVVKSGLVPARYAGTSRFDDFYRRKADGIGLFFDREYLDARAADRSDDILRAVPGVRIRYRGSTPYIQFLRCEQVEVYIDGFRSHDGFVSFLELNPKQIEAVEVYRGISTVPPEFSPMPNDCAAVVVWTRWH